MHSPPYGYVPDPLSASYALGWRLSIDPVRLSAGGLKTCDGTNRTMRDTDNPEIHSRENTPWLSSYRNYICAGARVLDLGCGTGEDSLELAGFGCRVTALDLDPLRILHVPGHAADRVVGDIAAGLPFIDEAFDCVVASLSLHYFVAAETEHAVAEIARILRPHGPLLSRVNAVGDTNFGYALGEEVEPSLFRQPEGHLKRFFDPEMLQRSLEPCFRLEQIKPRTILQRGIEKCTIECVARKR